MPILSAQPLLRAWQSPCDLSRAEILDFSGSTLHRRYLRGGGVAHLAHRVHSVSSNGAKRSEFVQSRSLMRYGRHDSISSRMERHEAPGKVLSNTKYAPRPPIIWILDKSAQNRSYVG
jgi:hypothetical protein